MTFHSPGTLLLLTSERYLTIIPYNGDASENPELP
jgi:hypothetical protein